MISEDNANSRRQLRRDMLSIVGTPTAVTGVENFSIDGPTGELPVRHYRPEQAAGAPLLVFYHGGGFVVGDLDTQG